MEKTEKKTKAKAKAESKQANTYLAEYLWPMLIVVNYADAFGILVFALAMLPLSAILQLSPCRRYPQMIVVV